MRSWLLTALGLLALGAACRARDFPGERHTLTFAGVERIYYVHAPPGESRNHRTPVVLNLHGGGGDAAGTARLTGMNQVADAHGFLVVYPEGIDRHWNDGRGLSSVDDVGFVSALLEDLRGSYSLDADRIYATGMSNGGFFSTRLACEPGSPIAAIAVVAATMPEALPAACKADRAVSALFVFGDQDPIVKMGGGAVASNRGTALSLAAAVDFWRRRDGITQAPLRAELPRRNTDDGTSILRESATGGKSGSEVTLYLVHGGGHTWPGGRPYLPFIVGKTSSQLDASETIWEFFARHPMRMPRASFSDRDGSRRGLQAACLERASNPSRGTTPFDGRTAHRS